MFSLASEACISFAKKINELVLRSLCKCLPKYNGMHVKYMGMHVKYSMHESRTRTFNPSNNSTVRVGLIASHLYRWAGLVNDIKPEL